jgi:tetratricopeptide (TPR) repeat protein
MEGGWLLAVVLIPSYFNLLSARHFEPDKATTLRAIVLIVVAAALIRWLETLANRTNQPAATAEIPPTSGAFARLRALPLALPTIFYALVFIITTLTSIMPATSFWGSYQRLQGTYTNLSYVLLGVVVALNLRRRDQLDRLLLMMVLGSLPAVGYGLIQHSRLDPLPWGGDVITRIASTMGNSIFVAAYLIMIVPITLYFAITAFHTARQAPMPERTGGAIGWYVAYLFLTIGGVILVFAALQFGAVVRSADLGFWWVYPGSLVVATALFLIPTLARHRAERLNWTLFIPAAIALLYLLFLMIGFSTNDNPIRPPAGRTGSEWGMWALISFGLITVGYVLMLVSPRSPGEATRLGSLLQGLAMLGIVVLQCLTIFYTQSRGPWIGLGAGLAVFFTLLLMVAIGRARKANSPRLGLLRGLLIGEILLVLSLGGFLLAFNLSDAPVFQQLRQVPYIGRLGTLLETDRGTGLVRRLIWTGDEQAGGALALITADPFRMVFGWGPESMFVAYNQFYPPSLALVESRGASPDRSHQAYLDELVTKGILGLASFFFVVISFYVFAWQLVKRSSEWHWQVLFITTIGIATCHLVEGLTGIPIVATLMTFWMTLGLTVAGGVLAGHVVPQTTSTSEAAPVTLEPTLAKQPTGHRRRQANNPRAASQGRAGTPSAKQNNPLGWLMASAVLLVALLGAWFFNVDNVYADMRFQQGQFYTETPNADLNQQLVGIAYYLDAIRMEPAQDFYYLNLGRSLMTVVDIRRQNSQIPPGAIKENPRFENLMVGDLRAAEQFVLSGQAATTLPGSVRNPRSSAEYVLNLSLLETMSYARAVLERAQQISPRNKDHYANLGRMYTFWYSRLSRNQADLEAALDWYKRGTEIAPQDVVILNEYAGTIALYGSHLQSAGDQAGANQQYELAAKLLAESKATDSRFADTDLRIADLQRLRGQLREATDFYITTLERNPKALDNQIAGIIESLRTQPEQLTRLRDTYTRLLDQRANDPQAYAILGLMAVRLDQLPDAVDAFSRQTQLAPQNLEAWRNYTLVLSDTKQYQRAADSAQQLEALAQQLGQGQSYQGLAEYFRGLAAQP